MILHHVSVGVADVAKAGKFYDAVLGALGYKRYWDIMPYAIAYGEDGFDFWVQLPANQQSAHAGNGLHIAFIARTKDAVRKFHQVALAHGAKDNGAPGPRPDYGSDYFGAFVIDPDGNKLEATLHPETKKAATAPKGGVKAKAKKKKAAPKKKAAKRKTKKR